jgi:hypothetical protein
MIRTRPLLVVAASFGVLLGACSNENPVTTEVTPASEAPTTAVPAVPADGTLGTGESRLTTAQASTFSKVLTKNRADGGADFVATIPYGPAATFTVNGEIDWVNYAATATLNAKRSDGKPEAPIKMSWQTGQLAQEVVGLEAAMTAKGRKGITMTARPIDPKTSPLDRVIVLINSMANQRAENPILLRQRTDVAFAGSADLNGEAHDRYRYGSTTYWLSKSGGIGKLVAVFKDFAGPVEIVFTNKGPKTPVLPAASSVIASAEITDVLEALKKVSSTN